MRITWRKGTKVSVDMIRDLDLSLKFKLLYEKPVYFYGAGKEGKKVLEFMRKLDIVPQGFCDSNSALRGKMIDDVLIYTLDQLMDIADKQDIMIIITSTIHRDSIIKVLMDNKINCKNIYTLFSLFYAIYFNRNNPILSKENQKMLNEMFDVWVYNESLKLHAKQAECTLKSLMLQDENNIPIIVYQPGKVGSNAVYETLKANNVDALRSHGLAYIEREGGAHLKNAVIEKIRKFKKVKMITLIREPIAKDIGHFFQKATMEEGDIGWIIKGIMEQDFQNSFLNYLSIVTPMDFCGKKEEYDRKIISHIDYINIKTNLGAYWGWYEEELKKNFGIDILEYPFDTEKGYTIIYKENIELLVLKLEKLDELKAVIGEFVGKEIMPILKVNCAQAKSYKYAYKQFYQEVILPKEYIEFYYKNNIYTNHFYSETERASYLEKWSVKQ